MQQMLEFWQKNQGEAQELTLMELMQKASQTGEEMEI